MHYNISTSRVKVHLLHSLHPNNGKRYSFIIHKLCIEGFCTQKNLMEFHFWWHNHFHTCNFQSTTLIFFNSKLLMRTFNQGSRPSGHVTSFKPLSKLLCCDHKHWTVQYYKPSHIHKLCIEGFYTQIWWSNLWNTLHTIQKFNFWSQHK